MLLAGCCVGRPNSSSGDVGPPDEGQLHRTTSNGSNSNSNNNNTINSNDDGIGSPLQQQRHRPSGDRSRRVGGDDDAVDTGGGLKNGSSGWRLAKRRGGGGSGKFRKLLGGMRRELMARPTLIFMMHSVGSVCVLVEMLEIPFTMSLAICPIVEPDVENSLQVPVADTDDPNNDLVSAAAIVYAVNISNNNDTSHNTTTNNNNIKNNSSNNNNNGSDAFGTCSNTSSTCSSSVKRGNPAAAYRPDETETGVRKEKQVWGGLIDPKLGVPTGSYHCNDRAKVIKQGQALQVYSKTCTKFMAVVGGLAGASLADVCGRRWTMIFYLIVSAIATIFFAVASTSPELGFHCYLVGNLLQGLVKIPFMMKIFDLDCMRASQEPRVTKMMIDYSRSFVGVVIKFGGLFMLTRLLSRGPEMWNYVWMGLSALLVLLSALFLMVPLGLPPPKYQGGQRRESVLSIARAEAKSFWEMVKGRPESQAWILNDLLKACWQRFAKTERALVMLFFHLDYQHIAVYLSGVPFVAAMSLPLVPMILEKYGDELGYYLSFNLYLCSQAAFTLLLPFAWWMSPLRIYSASLFSGIPIVNMDIIQRIFGDDQAKLHSLAHAGTQVVALAADYLFLWSFDPESPSTFVRLRPIFMGVSILVLWGLVRQLHPGWMKSRAVVFKALEEERQERAKKAKEEATSEHGKQD